MSHEVEIIEGRGQVMLKNSAWHKLGYVVRRAFGWKDAVDEGLAITLDVTKVPLADILTPFPGIDGVSLRAQADDHANVRQDGLVLATGLGNQLTVFHARDGYDFGQCIRETAEQDGVDASLLSLGTLYEGRRWFMTFDLGSFSIGDYAVRDYLSVNGSYDSSWQLQVLSSPTIEVCANTVAAAKAMGVTHYRFKHTSGIFDRVEEAKRALRRHQLNRDAFATLGEALLATPVSSQAYGKVLASIFPTDDEVPNRTKLANEKAIEKVTEEYTGPRVSEKGNGWAVVQAVNTYENWLAPIRKTAGRGEGETRALRQVEQLNSGKQVLTAKAIELVGALN